MVIWLFNTSKVLLVKKENLEVSNLTKNDMKVIAIVNQKGGVAKTNYCKFSYSFCCCK